MAVTRADKQAELQLLEAAFKGSDTAILVDYKGMNVPQVTELRRQLRVAKARYTVVKNTLAKRALKGTSFEVLEKLEQMVEVMVVPVETITDRERTILIVWYVVVEVVVALMVQRPAIWGVVDL